MTLRVSRLIVDVLLPEATVTAVVSVLAEGDVLEAGARYRAEIGAVGERPWRVAGSAVRRSPYSKAFDTHALEAVGEVSMSVATESEGEVHFDNLTIANN